MPGQLKTSAGQTTAERNDSAPLPQRIDLPELLLRACGREGLGRHVQIASLLSMSESQVAKALSWNYADNPVLKGLSVTAEDTPEDRAIKVGIIRAWSSLMAEAVGMEFGTLSTKVHQIEQIMTALRKVLG